MSLEQFKKDVSDWILDWVSQPNEQLGHVPCPFARNALLSDKIHWIWCDDHEHLLSNLYFLMEEGLPKEVVALGCDPNIVTSEQLRSITAHANKKWLLPCELVALEDHPNDPEIVAGTKMNQGTHAMVLVQSVNKLNAASDMLRKQGYYDNWTQDQLDDVVTWRR